jgi:hypothetical protein
VVELGVSRTAAPVPQHEAKAVERCLACEAVVSGATSQYRSVAHAWLYRLPIEKVVANRDIALTGSGSV